MSGNGQAPRLSLHERLSRRRGEIEQAILARARSVSDPIETEDPGYVAGLRDAVAAAVGYGLTATREEDDPNPPIPLALFAQARHAARGGVSLDTVLRRYVAGYSLLGDFIIQEGERDERLGREQVHRLLRAQARLFDRLVVAITKEYRSEALEQSRHGAHALTERVRRLLAGELVAAADLGYELGGRWHIGIVASGPGAQAALRGLAARFDRLLLLARPEEGVVWGWLGGAEKVSAEEIVGLASADWPEEVALVLGEPARGISGWRLTHRQAIATREVAQRVSRPIVRYGEVALLVSALRDDVLSSSLREIYLAPLEEERDGGALLRATLRAYFESRCNVSSAAAALRLSRPTVTTRLRTAERRIGCQLETRVAEIETALRLQGLDAPALG